MLIICGTCKKHLSEQPPYELRLISHSVCKSCKEKTQEILRIIELDVIRELHPEVDDEEEG